MRSETAWDREMDLLTSARAEASQLSTQQGRASAERDARDDGRATHRVAAPEGYLLIRRLGRGAQGEVWEAQREANGQRVALKLLAGEAAPGSEDAWRLRREAKLLGRLAHPGIVAAIDCGEAPGGGFYVAMELVQGAPLDQYVRQRGLSVSETCTLMIAVCQAVGAAHLRGVMHRDLKPSNILVDVAGRPRVLDFGLARPLEAEAGTEGAQTARSGFIGTLAWASPEQIAGSGADVDLRSDVYSLGVILYEALTGVLPHNVDGPLGQVTGAITGAAPTRPRSLRKDIPRDIETIVLKCLSKDRERRYGTASEVAADLRRALDGAPITARRDSALYLTGVMLRRHKLATSAAAACLLVGLGVGLAGGAMLAEAQQDLKVAQQDLQVAQAENQQLREDLEELKAALVEPANWTGAFTSGSAISKLPPEEGWQVIQAAWAEMEGESPKQQLLKMAHFAKLPYVVRVLDLGATDPAVGVQNWAFTYLREIAFIDFAEDYTAYKAWAAQHKDATREEALRANFRRWGQELMAMDAAEFGRTISSRHWMGIPLGEEAVREVAEDLGLVDRLLKMAGQPGDAGAAAGGIISRASLDEQRLRERILPLIEPSQPLAVRARAATTLASSQAAFALDGILQAIEDAVREEDRAIWTFAQALAELKDPRAIPTMIGLIDAREGYDTVYGIGYFGLGRITGVRYDQSHGGNWWRDWWEKNRERFGPEVAAMAIPEFDFAVERTPAEKNYYGDAEDDVEGLLEALTAAVAGTGEGRISTIAGRLAEAKDPGAIPPMIALIDAHDKYDTVYGIGYFGLGGLTGVKYDESHDGAWWRSWWEKNRGRYGERYASMEIPSIELPQPEGEAGASAAPGQIEPGIQRLHAGGDARKVYILNEPAAGAQAAAPEGGWKLLLVLPGGDGSADFQPFVTRIARQALPEGWLLAQLVAPQWSEDPERIVWPTEKTRADEVEFTTEALITAVVEDVKQRHKIAEGGVFAMGWSSGGPPVYAAAVAEDSPLRGAFVAMSVFKPDQMAPLEGAKDKAFYILHSPQDFIPMQWPESARDKLAEAGAETNLETYEGGHGWHGDVYGMIRRGVEWLQEQADGR